MDVSNGAYVPNVAKKQLDHKKEQRVANFKNKQRLRIDNNNVFSVTKTQGKTVNKVVKTKQEIQHSEMIWQNGAYLSSFVIERQEYIESNSQYEKIQKTNVEKESFIKEDFVSLSKKHFKSLIPVKVKTKIHKDVLRVTKFVEQKEVTIGEDYLADCGFDASWTFKCANWKYLPICVDDISDGAWVPFIIMYRKDYYDCSFVKATSGGREFSQDYGSDYN